MLILFVGKDVQFLVRIKLYLHYNLRDTISSNINQELNKQNLYLQLSANRCTYNEVFTSTTRGELINEL